MSRINWLEKEIAKLEKHIDKEKNRAENLNHKQENKRNVVRIFSPKSVKIEDKIKTMDLKIISLQGRIVKEKLKLKIKSEEKEERKRREKKYLEWSGEYEGKNN
jgi:hypothetical protein